MKELFKLIIIAAISWCTGYALTTVGIKSYKTLCKYINKKGND